MLEVFTMEAVKLIRPLKSIYKISAVSYLRTRALSFASTQSRTFSSGSSGGMIVDPDDMTPPIPSYTERSGEDMVLKRARLLYQSRKRGMLENGLLLSTFAGKYLDTFTDNQLDSYDKLINQPTNDWEIYYWVTEAKETPAEYHSDVMDLLKKHAKNEEKDSRISQPDL